MVFVLCSSCHLKSFLCILPGFCVHHVFWKVFVCILPVFVCIIVGFFFNIFVWFSLQRLFRSHVSYAHVLTIRNPGTSYTPCFIFYHVFALRSPATRVFFSFEISQPRLFLVMCPHRKSRNHVFQSFAAIVDPDSVSTSRISQPCFSELCGHSGSRDRDFLS